jgi:hypothetical protein
MMDGRFHNFLNDFANVMLQGCTYNLIQVTPNLSWGLCFCIIYIMLLEILHTQRFCDVTYQTSPSFLWPTIVDKVRRREIPYQGRT